MSIAEEFVCQCCQSKVTDYQHWVSVGFTHGDHSHLVEFPVCLECMQDGLPRSMYDRIKEEVTQGCIGATERSWWRQSWLYRMWQDRRGKG